MCGLQEGGNQGVSRAAGRGQTDCQFPHGRDRHSQALRGAAPHADSSQADCQMGHWHQARNSSGSWPRSKACMHTPATNTHLLGSWCSLVTPGVMATLGADWRAGAAAVDRRSCAAALAARAVAGRATCATTAAAGCACSSCGVVVVGVVDAACGAVGVASSGQLGLLAEVLVGSSCRRYAGRQGMQPGTVYVRE